MKSPDLNLAFFKKWLSYGERPQPSRDWFVLLTLFVLLLGGIIVWNIQVFQTTSGGEDIGSISVSSAHPVTSASLDSVRRVFTARSAEEQKYVSGAYTYADPSQ